MSSLKSEGSSGILQENVAADHQSTCCCSDNTDEASLVMNDCFADCVAKASHAVYASLPKTGKPQPGQEWTLLASVLEVISEYFKQGYSVFLFDKL